MTQGELGEKVWKTNKQNNNNNVEPVFNSQKPRQFISVVETMNYSFNMFNNKSLWRVYIVSEAVVYTSEETVSLMHLFLSSCCSGLVRLLLLQTYQSTCISIGFPSVQWLQTTNLWLLSLGQLAWCLLSSLLFVINQRAGCLLDDAGWPCTMTHRASVLLHVTSWHVASWFKLVLLGVQTQ